MPERIVGCHACSNEHRFEDVVPRRADCERCGEPLHSCRNCSFYDRSAYNECREPSAERVVEKGAANFCDFFVPVSTVRGARGTDAAGGAQDANPSTRTDALERLFKK